MHPFNHPFTLPSLCPLIHLSIHLFIHPSFTSTFNLSPICLLPIYLSIDPFSSNDSCLSTHAAIHLSILPYINFSFHHSIMHPSIQSLLWSLFTSLDPSKHPLPLYPCHPHQEIPHWLMHFSLLPSLTLSISSALLSFLFFFWNKRLGSGPLVQLKKKRGKEESNNELGPYGERKQQEASGMDFHAVPDFVIFRTEYLNFLGANLHII